MTPEKIARINELARKSRSSEGLTADEKDEQTALRNEYRRGVINNLTGQLDNIEIVDKNRVEKELEK